MFQVNIENQLVLFPEVITYYIESRDYPDAHLCSINSHESVILARLLPQILLMTGTNLISKSRVFYIII